MTDTENLPVLVVGGGPVGLATAFFLTCHGVRPLVVERRGGTGLRPRANTSPRTVELLRAAGLAPALDRIGWLPRDPYGMVFKDHGVGPVLVRRRQPRRTGRRLMTCTPSPRLMVTSDQLELLLAAETRARGGEVRFDTRLVDFDADDAGVRARVVNTVTGERREVRAAYLVAADGARSGVRARLGVTMPDLTVVGTVDTVMYRADIDGLPDPEARFCFVRNDEVYAAIGSVNGRDLWGTHIMDYPGKPESPEPLSRERIIELLHAAIGDRSVDIEVLAATPWEARLGVASSFRQGRVFLAGDAAHVQTSAGGLGMNTGIQDGHNLAWKLAAVLRGQAAPALLDTYEPERRAAATLSVDCSRSASHGVGIGASGQGAPEVLREGHEYADRAYLRAMMFYRYRSDAVIEGDQPDEDLDVLRDDARPGYRLPHHWLVRGGDRVSTVDVAGTGWLLLAGPRGDGWVSAAATLDVEMRAHRVVPGTGTGSDVDRGGDGATLGDPDGTFSDLAGTGQDGALLVRPDGFVCWRAPSTATDPAATLRDAVHRILGRRPRAALRE